MTCPKCQGALYPDRTSVSEALVRGYCGGRFRCAQGCTDRWVIEFVGVPTMPPQQETLAHTRYHHWVRKTRAFTCQRCHSPGETKSSNAKYCPPCKRLIHQERERLRARRDRKKAAA